MFLHIVLMIVAAIIALSVVFHFTPWSKANRFRRLLSLAEQGDDQAFYAITSREGPWMYWVNWSWRKKLSDRAKVLKAAIDELRSSANQRERLRCDAEKLAKRQAELRAKVEWWRERLLLLPQGDEATEGRLEQEIGILQKWSQALEDDRATIPTDLFDPDHLRREINREFSQLRDRLAIEASGGDLPAFNRLHLLLETFARRGKDKSLKSVGLPHSWPKQWDTLAARYVDIPTIADFLWRADWQDGEISLMAREAVRRQDLTTAKIVMASCNALPARRTELGDVLWADLIKFVDAENVRLRTERLRSEREQADQVG